MLAFIGAWMIARGITFMIFVALLPLACVLYLGTEMLGTPNIEWLMDGLYRFVVTPIVEE